MSASKDNLHERLRLATRPLHDDLERAVAVDRCIATLSAYKAYLLGLFRVHTAIERSLQHFDFTPYGFNYPWPYRSRLIAQDLEVLGFERARATPPRLDPSLALEGMPAALGCLYVVEGSAIGARAILPEIRTLLGLDATRGATFFAGFGRETNRLWRALISAINGISPVSEEGDRAVDTAVATFRLFREELAPERERIQADVRVASCHRRLGP